MNIRELLETLAQEATTQQAEYESEFQDALTKAVGRALNQVHQELPEIQDLAWDKAQEWFQDGKTGLMRHQIYTRLLKPLEPDLIQSMSQVVAQMWGSDPEGNSGKEIRISWQDLGSHHGEALPGRVNLNQEMLQELARALAESVTQKALKNPRDPGEAIAQELESLSQDLEFPPESRVQKALDQISSTLVHELTHSQQFRRQEHRPDWEYRSGLERHPGELGDMTARILGTQGAQKLKPEEEERWWELYHSSLQEIPAFSNQIAARLTRQAGVQRVTDPSELAKMTPQNGYFTAHELAQAVDEHTRHRFSRARPEETETERRLRQQIWRRYVDRTYKSIEKILTRRRQQLEQQQQQQKTTPPTSTTTTNTTV